MTYLMVVTNFIVNIRCITRRNPREKRCLVGSMIIRDKEEMYCPEDRQQLQPRLHMCVVQVVVTETVNVNIGYAHSLYTIMDIILRVATMVVALGYVEIFLSPSEVWVSLDLEEAIL